MSKYAHEVGRSLPYVLDRKKVAAGLAHEAMMAARRHEFWAKWGFSIEEAPRVLEVLERRAGREWEDNK